MTTNDDSGGVDDDNGSLERDSDTEKQKNHQSDHKVCSARRRWVRKRA